MRLAKFYSICVILSLTAPTLSSAGPGDPGKKPVRLAVTGKQIASRLGVLFGGTAYGLHRVIKADKNVDLIESHRRELTRASDQLSTARGERLVALEQSLSNDWSRKAENPLADRKLLNISRNALSEAELTQVRVLSEARAAMNKFKATNFRVGEQLTVSEAQVTLQSLAMDARNSSSFARVLTGMWGLGGSVYLALTLPVDPSAQKAQ